MAVPTEELPIREASVPAPTARPGPGPLENAGKSINAGAPTGPQGAANSATGTAAPAPSPAQPQPALSEPLPAQIDTAAVQGSARPKPLGRPSTATPTRPAGQAASPPVAVDGAAGSPAIPAAPLITAVQFTESAAERVIPDQPGASQPGREQAGAPAVAVTAPPTGPAAPTNMAAAPNLGAAIAAQVLDLARGGEWINEIARDIAKSASADGAMRFRLAPETLGELRVEITHSERGAHVRLQVTSEAAQQALAEASPKLVQEARAQGVRIAEAEVSFAGGHSPGRDPSRQAPPDQPMRSLRSAPDHQATSGDRSQPVRRGRTDLYA